MEMERREITEKIIGCAYRVYNSMGFGFLESVYEKCLVVEMTSRGLAVEVQKAIPVRYPRDSGGIVGEFVADLVVEGKVIVEIKAIEKLSKIHEIRIDRTNHKTCPATPNHPEPA